jgi:hypothetical protein
VEGVLDEMINNFSGRNPCTRHPGRTFCGRKDAATLQVKQIRSRTERNGCVKYEEEQIEMKVNLLMI